MLIEFVWQLSDFMDILEFFNVNNNIRLNEKRLVHNFRGDGQRGEMVKSKSTMCDNMGVI